MVHADRGSQFRSQTYVDTLARHGLTGPHRRVLRIFDLAGGMRVGDMNASQIGSTSVPALIALAVLMLTAAAIGVIRRDALGLVLVLQAILISCLDWRTLLYPHEMYRIPAVPALLAALLVVIHFTRIHTVPRHEEPASIRSAETEKRRWPLRKVEDRQPPRQQ